MLTTNLASKDMVQRYGAFCRLVGSEYSLSVKHDMEVVGALRALKRVAPRPDDYSDAKSFGMDWMVYNYLRKYPGLAGSTLKNRSDEALRSWVAAESKCRSTNGRIEAFERGYGLPLVEFLPTSGAPVTVVTVILAAQRKIARVLGQFNEKRLLEECRWSNGATLDLKRGTPRTLKMTSQITVTRQALPLLRKVISRDLHWTASILGCEPAGYASLLPCCFNVENFNRHELVPKSAYTERSIGIEPTGNAFLQQGAGRYIRGRLKRVGVDLDDQSLSQAMARKAVSEGLSTLDLESASDTVSRKLVHLLLPVRWFRYLDSLRTPITKLKDGRMFLLEKFSSMGNAFTFELESLLFWALASSVAELTSSGRSHFVTVYGDDIIVPRESSMALKQVLELFGFALNGAKSFFRGPFFESCGKHYFHGEDVTPVAQDSLVATFPEVIRYYNRVVRWNVRMTGSLFSTQTGPLIVGLKYGPHKMPFCEEGDECFVVPIDETRDIPYCRNHGYLLDAVIEVLPLRSMPRQSAAYAYKLRRPRTLNEDPRGYSAYAGSGVYRRTQVRRSGDIYLPL